MQFNNFPFNFNTKDPLIYSPFFKNNDEGLIVPGPGEFISTQSLINLTTEDGIALITEG